MSAYKIHNKATVIHLLVSKNLPAYQIFNNFLKPYYKKNV